MRRGWTVRRRWFAIAVARRRRPVCTRPSHLDMPFSSRSWPCWYLSVVTANKNAFGIREKRFASGTTADRQGGGQPAGTGAH